jgi:O-acetylserine/cysteine efflux transporter
MEAVAPPKGLTPRDLVIAAGMNLMWGLNLIAVKMSVDLVEPITAAFLRQAMVLVICLPALKLMPGRMRPLLLLGLMSGALFYIANNLSLSVSDNVSALAIAGQLGVPFSLILAVVFLGERIQKFRIIGVALSFAGVVLIVFDPDIVDERLGLALMTLTSLIWAFCSLLQRQLIGVPVLTIYAWIGLVGSMVLAPVALIVEPDAVARIPQIPLSTLGWILFSALGSTVIGQGAMSYLLQRHSIGTVVPLTLAAPVIAIIAGSLWFGTRLTPLIILGGMIVMVGIAIVTIRTARKDDEGRAA